MSRKTFFPSLLLLLLHVLLLNSPEGGHGSYLSGGPVGGPATEVRNGSNTGRGRKREGATAGPGAGNGTGWAGVFWSTLA